MTELQQASLPQYFRQDGHLTSGKDLEISLLVAPVNAEDLMYTAHVEAI